MGDLHRIYDGYKDRASFLTIYISEAHPDDEWQVKANREEKIVFAQPKTEDERKAAARVLVDQLEYRVPLALDAMDGRAEKAFAGWPERIYVIGSDGKIAYKGGMGPFDFDPEEAEQALAKLVGPAASSTKGGDAKAPGELR
ncbi:hypothetical protein HY251_11945 [bacterium]|nr:hypothetical protein [bacterium]